MIYRHMLSGGEFDVRSPVDMLLKEEGGAVAWGVLYMHGASGRCTDPRDAARPE